MDRGGRKSHRSGKKLTGMLAGRLPTYVGWSFLLSNAVWDLETGLKEHANRIESPVPGDL